MNILQFQWSNEQGDREFHVCQVDDVPRQGDTVVIEKEKEKEMIWGVVKAVVWAYKVTRITGVSPEMETACRPVVLLDDVQRRPTTEYPDGPDYERVVSKS